MMRRVGSATHLFALEDLPSLVDVLMVLVTLCVCYALRVALHRCGALRPGWQFYARYINERNKKQSSRPSFRQLFSKHSETAVNGRTAQNTLLTILSGVLPQKRQLSPVTASVHGQSSQAMAVAQHRMLAALQDSVAGAICSQLLGREEKHWKFGQATTEAGLRRVAVLPANFGGALLAIVRHDHISGPPSKPDKRLNIW